MTKLIICRGLPASGKTTKAEAWVREDPVGRARVNRDDIRRTLHAGEWSREREQVTRGTRDALVRSLLRRGVSVVSDDTNLDQKTARGLWKLAQECGADVEVWDFTGVSLDTCLERNSGRLQNFVPREVIIGMYEKYLKGGRTLGPVHCENAVVKFAPYEPAPHWPKAAIFDIDGTLALKGDRSPYDESRVGEDWPNENVARVLYALKLAKFEIFYLSGRTEGCRRETLAWLRENIDWDVTDRQLRMRAVGDTRKDSIVKRELLDDLEGWRVLVVFDDRQQVVDMWREIGLTCFQVAPGDF